MSYAGVPALGHDVPGDLAHGHAARIASAPLRLLVPQLVRPQPLPSYTLDPSVTPIQLPGATVGGGGAAADPQVDTRLATDHGGRVFSAPSKPPEPSLKTVHGFSFFVMPDEFRLFLLAVLAGVPATQFPGPCASGAITLKVPGPKGAIVTKVPCGDLFVSMSQHEIPGGASEPAIKWYHRVVDAGFGVISVSDSILADSGVKGAARYCLGSKGTPADPCISGSLLATKSVEVAARLTNPEGLTSHVAANDALLNQTAIVVTEPSGGWLGPDDVDESGQAKSDEKSGLSLPLLVGGAVVGVGLITVAVVMMKRKK